MAENSVNVLQTTNFSTLPLEKKLEIKALGGPLPLLSISQDRSCKGNDFRNVSRVDLLQFLIENNVVVSFSEVSMRLKITATVPMSTSEAERCFSTLKQMKTFLRNTMEEERLMALAMISIEKSMVTECVDFDERVINMFQQTFNSNTILFRITGFDLIANKDPFLKKILENCPQSAKYTKHSIQNELLAIMAKLTLNSITKKDLKVISDFFQNKECDIGNACVIVQANAEQLNDMRNSLKQFQDLLAESKKLAAENCVDIDKGTPRERRLSQHLYKYIVREQLPNRRENLSNEDDLRQYTPIIDRAISEMNRRFTVNSSTLSQITTLHPEIASFLAYEILNPFLGHYHCDKKAFK
ncbi:hypothetical protein ANN_19316 [Periplaneta americana]|uniref:HAT C-terminal dimerisation domain-containing protein n=1 Tax=Periplaneta americana TaxID=6978 RepID=A0ABQ8SAG8_PERAM|nr:hypothetical protein ANN_19316 [Periplaneta americana]